MSFCLKLPGHGKILELRSKYLSRALGNFRKKANRLQNTLSTVLRPGTFAYSQYEYCRVDEVSVLPVVLARLVSIIFCRYLVHILILLN